jgi:lysyl-tRNA synthetase, class II
MLYVVSYMALEDIRNDRLKKLELLQAQGIDAYPATSERSVEIGSILADFDTLPSETALTIAGRVRAFREHGGSLFIDLNDGTGRIQGYLKKDELGDVYDLFVTTVDVGDFIDLTGTPMRTKRGELSILASGWKMLSKSLRPIPDSWVGFTDPDERLRKRYLDLIVQPELQDLFKKKTLFWGTARAFLKEHGFIEIETPTLEITTGGAEARPFKTHHNDFDLDVYLRISVGELWQKRLMAAGFPRTFEIGRVYRNEGSSPEHLQEFTNLEFYGAYINFEEGKKLVQDLYRMLAREVFGTTAFTTRGHSFDLADEWKELDYVSTVEEMTGVNVLEASEIDLMKKLDELDVSYQGKTRERLADSLWKYCRKKISGPAFLLNHPKLVAPLSKEHPDDQRLTNTFQVILAGSEIGRAHNELNDPQDQKRRFDEQKALIEAGDEEAMMSDDDYVEMMEYGMPPTFGFGTGERLFAFFADKPIRETQLFPLMKPKGSEGSSPKKSKELKVGVMVINKGAGLEPWQELNTVAHLNAAFGARLGRQLLSREQVKTNDDIPVKINIQHALIIKETKSNTDLKRLLGEARTAGLEIAEFTREMLETTNDNKIAEITGGKSSDQLEHLGVFVFGDKSIVESLTERFPRYS